MADPIITALDNSVFTVTLNNAAKHNCMGLEMLNQLNEAIQYAHREEAVNVVVIRGAGDRSFSTGANLKEFNALEGKEIDDWILLGHDIFSTLESLPKPTVAYIDGYAMGGGLELALCCDFRLVTEQSVLSFPEVSHGWLPGWGGIPRATRLIGEAGAKRLILLSERLTAQEAYQLGLATRVLNTEEQSAQVTAFTEQLRLIKPATFRLAKSAIRQVAAGHPVDPHFDVRATHFAKNQKDE